ncbi:hypothetical protein Syun_001559 [Stephania yunnanensis]|uniref:Uncharacterized protein n=1 Tax=Stephania yunnanensis TaxID=152371 RepID=A0AAP0Q7W1_9MAGN
MARSCELGLLLEEGFFHTRRLRLDLSLELRSQLIDRFISFWITASMRASIFSPMAVK